MFVGKIVSISVSKSLFNVCVENPISLSVRKLVPRLGSKVCFAVRVGKPIFMSVSESLFPCLCQETCFHVSVGNPVFTSGWESMFPCSCWKVCFHVCVGKHVPNQCRKAYSMSVSIEKRKSKDAV